MPLRRALRLDGTHYRGDTVVLGVEGIGVCRQASRWVRVGPEARLAGESQDWVTPAYLPKRSARRSEGDEVAVVSSAGPLDKRSVLTERSATPERFSSEDSPDRLAPTQTDTALECRTNNMAFRVAT